MSGMNWLKEEVVIVGEAVVTSELTGKGGGGGSLVKGKHFAWKLLSEQAPIGQQALVLLTGHVSIGHSDSGILNDQVGGSMDRLGESKGIQPR